MKSAARKREQALEAVRRAEGAGHTLPDQAMRAPSAAKMLCPTCWTKFHGSHSCNNPSGFRPSDGFRKAVVTRAA